MNDVGMALVDWSEDVDDLIHFLADSRMGGAGEAKSPAPTIPPGREPVRGAVKASPEATMGDNGVSGGGGQAGDPGRKPARLPRFRNVHLLTRLTGRRGSSTLPQGEGVVIPFPAARIGHRPARP